MKIRLILIGHCVNLSSKLIIQINFPTKIQFETNLNIYTLHYNEKKITNKKNLLKN